VDGEMSTREAPSAYSGDVDGRASTEPEIISLTVPHDERFLNVARIVVGGLAARLDLPYESLDDLQLAVETVLAQPRYQVAEEVTVEILVQERLLAIQLGPLDVERIAADLERDEDGFGLRVLLAAVVDSFTFDGPGPAPRYLRLEKQVPPATTAS
jgi:hypothetical protein